MKAASLSAILLAVCTVPSFAQLEDADPTQTKCQQYLKSPLPSPRLAVPATFPQCDSISLFYGEWNTTPDFKSAADCAWKERAYLLSDLGKAPVDANTPISIAQIEGGSLTLAMFYANGLGVQRSVPVALHLVCEAGGSGAVIDYALEALEQEEKSPPPADMKDYFVACNYGGGTRESDICADWAEQVKNADRKRALARIGSSWTRADQKAAFARLQAAADSYFHNHADGELNRAGTIRGIHEMEELGDFRDEFVKNLRELSNGPVQKSTGGDFLGADRTLNLTYRALLAQAKAHENEYGAVAPEDIRSTERAWLEYRDRWVGFATLVRPEKSADTWLTLLTKRRIEVLNSTADEVGNGSD